MQEGIDIEIEKSSYLVWVGDTLNNLKVNNIIWSLPIIGLTMDFIIEKIPWLNL